MTTAIEKAVEAVGGNQSELARLISCTPQNISKMCKTGRVTAPRVIAIEKATGGRVTRHEMRPDLYPEAIDPASK